jgi:hypothetical protein
MPEYLLPPERLSRLRRRPDADTEIAADGAGVRMGKNPVHMPAHHGRLADARRPEDKDLECRRGLRVAVAHLCAPVLFLQSENLQHLNTQQRLII